VLKTSKGQAVIIDFALGFFLFVLIWVFLIIQFEEKLSDTIDISTNETMKIRTENALEVLVKSRGSPENWEQLTINDLNAPGLAKADRELSQQKLIAFQNLNADYNQLKTTMGLEGFEFYFEFIGEDNYTSGIEPPTTGFNNMVLERIVEYKGGVGTARLTVYIKST